MGRGVRRRWLGGGGGGGGGGAPPPPPPRRATHPGSGPAPRRPPASARRTRAPGTAQGREAAAVPARSGRGAESQPVLEIRCRTSPSPPRSPFQYSTIGACSGMRQMPGAASTAPERTRWVREERMRSGNAADDHSWTGSSHQNDLLTENDKVCFWKLPPAWIWFVNNSVRSSGRSIETLDSFCDRLIPSETVRSPRNT